VAHSPLSTAAETATAPVTTTAIRLRTTETTMPRVTMERLEQAAGIAKAAETCAEAGNVEKGIEIVLESAQLITK
jgi:hypothetical protein